MKIAKILPIVGLLALSGTAWGQSGICSNVVAPNYSNGFDPNLVLVHRAQNPHDNIYFCRRSNAHLPAQTLTASRFGGSRSVRSGTGNGIGSLNSTNITVTSLNFNYNEPSLGNISYNTTAGNIINLRSATDSVFNFFTYHELTKDEFSGYSYDNNSYCNANNRQSHIYRHLKDHPEIFLVGEQESTSYSSGENLAKNSTTINGAEVNTVFQYKAKDGDRYAHPVNRNGSDPTASARNTPHLITHIYVYCLVRVSFTSTINLDTLKKAGIHRITYSVRSLQ